VSYQDMDREVVTARPAPLVPMAERRIPFHGDEIAAALVAGETGEPVIMVPVRPLCERLGLAWPPQYTRIQRDPVLRKAATSVTVTVTQGGRQRRTVLCLPADMLHGWLFGVSTGRVRPEYREALNLYRAECFAVLWRAYQAGELGAPGPRPDLAPSGAPAALAQVRATALAIAALAWPESVRALSQVSQPGDLDHTALIPQVPPRRKPGPSPQPPVTPQLRISGGKGVLLAGPRLSPGWTLGGYRQERHPDGIGPHPWRQAVLAGRGEP
jgi:hypothetical protein